MFAKIGHRKFAPEIRSRLSVCNRQSTLTFTQWTVIRYYIREKRRLVELAEPDPGCWVHLTPPFGPDELEEFARRFEFDPVFLTDSLDLDERARYERDEDVRFILINTPVKNQNAQEESEAYFITVPIGIILTIEHVITISAFETPVLDKFLENNVRSFNPADDKNFVLQILEQNVYYFLVDCAVMTWRCKCPSNTIGASFVAWPSATDAIEQTRPQV